MTNTAPTQLSRNVFERQASSANEFTTLRRVRQDKPRAPRARTASPQPAPLQNVMRPHNMNNNSSRSQNRPTPKRKTVHLTLWVKPVVKTQLQRIAEQEGLSVSAIGGAFLERGLQANIDMQYGAFLQPIIETTIRNELRRYFKQIVLFLARIALSLDVIKGLVKWLCRRLAGATKAQVDSVEEKSRKDARVNLGQRSPQLETLTKEYESALYQEQEAAT